MDGGKIWWVAPTYPIAMEIWRDLKRATRLASIDKSEQEHRIVLPGGGSVSVRSGDDPGSLVGVGLDGVVIDEAAKLRAEAWYESLRPTLADQAGWSVFIGTPKGVTNWFHELFRQAGESEGWERWQRPTSDNPVIPPEEIEAAKRDSPRSFGQEFEAKFMELEGAEWPAEYFPDSIWFDEWPSDFIFRILALDPSKGKDSKHGDYSAFVWAGVCKDGTLWVDADLERRPTTRIVEDGIAFCQSWRPHAFAVEANSFQELLGAEFARWWKEPTPLPIYGITNTVNKQVRIRQLGPLLAQSRIRFKSGSPGCRLLVQQLKDFPLAPHDDGCFVAGTMIETATGPRPIEQILVGDLVLTRFGYRRVLASGCTGVKEVVEVIGSNGESLTGTENHPVFDGMAFIPMGSACIMWRPMVDMSSVTVSDVKRKGQRLPVFNLTVDGAEYFANGFLVHNCDALQMSLSMLYYLLGRRGERDEPELLRV